MSEGFLPGISSILSSALAPFMKRQAGIAFSAAFCAVCSVPIMGSPGVKLFSNPLVDRHMEVMLNSIDSGTEAARYLAAEEARRREEYLYWGGLIARHNASLSPGEVYEIGRAVLRYSRSYGLTPRLVTAVIIVESHGRTRAVSPTGAKGLMQVMPWWTEALGIDEDLFAIDTNIRVGARILSENIRRWGYKEGILRYYRGSRSSDDGYFVKVERTLKALS